MAKKKETTNSPFTVGRAKTRNSGGGKFISIKPDESIIFAPLVGLDELISAEMHEYWDIRPAIYHPCIGPDCPGCAAGNESRWKGYLPVVIKGEDEVKILPFTSSINSKLEELEDAFDDDESLAGVVIKLSRKGSGLATRYSIVGTGKSLDVSEYEVPDFIDRLGPITKEDIEALLAKNNVGESSEDDEWS